MIETNLAQTVSATNDSYHYDLMKGIIVNIRNSSGESVKKSQDVLIAMLEELVSTKDEEEKKRILALRRISA